MDWNTGQSNELLGKIEAVSKTLGAYGIDSSTIARLDKILITLKNNPEQLLRVDFYKAFNLAGLAENANTAFIKNSKLNTAIVFFEIARNILVLFPILLTWYSLSQASKTYLEVVSSSPALLEKSFLLQWEEGFSNKLPTFSNMAFADAIIVIVIIFLTFLVMFLHNRQISAAASQSVRFVAEFEDMLWNIDLFLEPYRFVYYQNAEQKSLEIIQEVREFVNEFRSHSSELEKSIALERDLFKKLSEERQKDVEELRDFSSNLNQSSQNVIEFGQKLLKPVQDMQLATVIFSAKADEISQTQIQLIKALQTLEVHFAKFESAISELSKTQEKIASDLIEPTKLNLTNAQVTGESVKSLVISTRELDQTQKELSGLLSKELTANDTWVAGFRQTLKNIMEMMQVIQNFESSIKKLDTVAQSNVEIVSDLKAIIRSNSDVAFSLITFSNQISALRAEIQNLQKTDIPAEGTLVDISQKLFTLSQSISTISDRFSQVTKELRDSTVGTDSTKQEIQRLAKETIELREVLLQSGKGIPGKSRGSWWWPFGR